MKQVQISEDLFLSLIKYADFVVTNSFHCLIFALLFKKNFTYLQEHTAIIKFMNYYLVSI